VSTLAWIAVGAAVVVLLAIAVSIAAYPRDNSF
jgi:hypothetical protein